MATGRWHRGIVGLAVLAVLAACSNDGTGNEPSTTSPAPTTTTSTSLAVESSTTTTRRDLGPLRNLAMGRPADGSGAYQSAPLDAFDGDIDDSWNSGGYAPQWISVELETRSTLHRINLFPETGRTGETTHTILGWSDDSDTPVASTVIRRSMGNRTPVTVDLQPAWTGISRVQVCTVGHSGWIAWWEIRVFGRPDSGPVVSAPEPPALDSPIGSNSPALVYVTQRGSDFDLFRIDRFGCETQLLTDPGSNEMFPAWSPDGTRIAFASDSGGSADIFVVPAGGGDPLRLTNGITEDVSPAWSPDGQRIVFASIRPATTFDDEPESDEDGALYLMASDGSEVAALTGGPGIDAFPAWSPDGERIAFVSDRDGNPEIYVVNVDGSGLVRLTENPAADLEPAWSPDGSTIIFTSDREGSTDLYWMQDDGSELARLTDHPGEEVNPAWSPDGTRIAFATDRDGNFEIYAMDRDGSGLTRLSGSPGADFFPAWSPAA